MLITSFTNEYLNWIFSHLNKIAIEHLSLSLKPQKWLLPVSKLMWHYYSHRTNVIAWMRPNSFSKRVTDLSATQPADTLPRPRIYNIPLKKIIWNTESERTISDFPGFISFSLFRGYISEPRRLLCKKYLTIARNTFELNCWTSLLELIDS